MVYTVMAGRKLTDAAVRQAKAQEKAYKLTDGEGLYLYIHANGTKSWRYDYRFAGRRKTLAIGVYPQISLKDARLKLEEAKRGLLEGIDPSQDKQRKRRQTEMQEGSKFSLLAKEWWEHQLGKWTEGHSQRVWIRLENDVLPALGNTSIADIEPLDVLAVLRKVESRGALDVASRISQDINRICRYAIQTGRLRYNPAADLVGVLKARKTEHRPSLPRSELPGFLKELAGYDQQGRKLTQLAIKLLILTFVRSGELRGARWEEFDLKGRLWRLPAERMKMKTEHLVPLSSQAVTLLEEIKQISGKHGLLFPSERRRTDCMSDNTMRRAIFKLGYDGLTSGKSKVVPHGFRATASSILNEQGFNPDAIERQLAHTERNGVRAAYIHHARYMDERRLMMQWWADYLDQ